MEQANLVGFANHEAWAGRLFVARYREPPPGYAKITVQQLLNADARLFVRLAELTRAGVQATAAGRPLDLAWDQAMNDSTVMHLLQPMPVALAKERLGPYSPNKERPKGKGKGSGKTRMPEALKDGVPATTTGKPLCFDFNLGKCTRKVTRGACSRGLHLCCSKGCFKSNHRYLTCPNRTSE